MQPPVFHRHRAGRRPPRLATRPVPAALTALAAAVLYVLAAGPPAYADDIRDRQWHLSYLQVADAHRHSTGTGVIVAVIDTGVDATHPDLAGSVLPGRDAEHHRDGHTADTDGHGTAMAGLIAGHGHGPGNTAGVLGIAPAAAILPVRVFVDPDRISWMFNTARPKDDSDYVEAVGWAVAHGATVISMSTGAPSSAGVYDALAAAHQAGVVLVAAAGNKPWDHGVELPASHPDVIAVSGIDRTGRIWDGSVTGPEIRIAAPATDEVSTSAGGVYRTGTGTSDATAIVSGTVALIRARYPQLTADQVTARLLGTASDAGPPGWDPQYGHGIVNPAKALTDPRDLAGSPAAGQPVPSPASDVAAAGNVTPGGGSWWGLLCLLGLLAAAVAGGVARHRTRRHERDHTGEPSPATASTPAGPSPEGALTQPPNRAYRARHRHTDATPYRPPSTPRVPEMPATDLPHREIR